MDIILVFAVLGVALITLLVPTLEYEVRLRRRIREHYLKARGTTHRQILQSSLSSLRERISRIEADVQSLLSRRAMLEGEGKRELEKKLTMQVVIEELDKVPGIGPMLKDRIIEQCFDGTLESISGSHLVEGIGEQKCVAIREWVENTKLNIPHLLLGDFQGKADILEKYANLDGELEGKLKVSDLELRSLKQLIGKATVSLNSLEPVDASTFMAAYKGNSGAAEVATRYLIGVYPEWGRIPIWFKTLTEMSETA
jgi:hypothetical protein